MHTFYIYIYIFVVVKFHLVVARILKMRYTLLKNLLVKVLLGIGQGCTAISWNLFILFN
jgi:hypothetical protein